MLNVNTNPPQHISTNENLSVQLDKVASLSFQVISIIIILIVTWIIGICICVKQVQTLNKKREKVSQLLTNMNTSQSWRDNHHFQAGFMQAQDIQSILKQAAIFPYSIQALYISSNSQLITALEHAKNEYERAYLKLTKRIQTIVPIAAMISAGLIVAMVVSDLLQSLLQNMNNLFTV